MKWTRASGMAALIATLAIGLALSLGLWGSWTASAQDTFIVNDDTTPADGGCGTPDFATEDIGDAIDSGLVADGDTLVICEGTYNPPETIEVNKSLTIEGRAEASRADVKIEVTVGGSNAFSVTVDGVTIRHLTVDGPSNNTGIYLAGGTSGATISDVESTDWQVGIAVAGAMDTIVEDSSVHDNVGDGVHLANDVGTVVRDNEMKDNAANGVIVEGSDEALVEGNTISGNIDQQIWLKGKVNARILRNTVTTIAGSGGIFVDIMPAESLVIIGGRAEDANTFSGPFDPATDDYYMVLVCVSENTVDATYNWWGITNRTDIANRVFNDEDDASTECPAPNDVRGAVVFHPWAAGPAPTPTPSPTASPTATATATGTPTPTATPGATRTIDLSPPGWHDLAWSGANATDPGTVLACVAGKYSIAYAWEGPTAGFKRYVEGCAVPGICNMAPLNKYDTLLVNITAAASCVMPVAP
jgi:parallel beta-helix repeat protein